VQRLTTLVSLSWTIYHTAQTWLHLASISSWNQRNIWDNITSCQMEDSGEDVVPSTRCIVLSWWTLVTTWKLVEVAVLQRCLNIPIFLRFEVFMVVRMMMMMFFWVLALCRLVSRCQNFGETYYFHLLGQFLFKWNICSCYCLKFTSHSFTHLISMKC
jgi:hypothetical protein